MLDKDLFLQGTPLYHFNSSGYCTAYEYLGHVDNVFSIPIQTDSEDTHVIQELSNNNLLLVSGSGLKTMLDADIKLAGQKAKDKLLLKLSKIENHINKFEE